MAGKKAEKGLGVDEIDRQIAALQAERMKAVQRQEKEVVQSLRAAMTKVAPDRLAGFVGEVRKVCDEVLAAKG